MTALNSSLLLRVCCCYWTPFAGHFLRKCSGKCLSKFCPDLALLLFCRMFFLSLFIFNFMGRIWFCCCGTSSALLSILSRWCTPFSACFPRCRAAYKLSPGGWIRFFLKQCSGLFSLFSHPSSISLRFSPQLASFNALYLSLLSENC